MNALVIVRGVLVNLLFLMGFVSLCGLLREGSARLVDKWTCRGPKGPP